jgi:hypothetical protein
MLGRAVAQAVSRLFSTAAARVKLQTLLINLLFVFLLNSPSKAGNIEEVTIEVEIWIVANSKGPSTLLVLVLV